MTAIEVQNLRFAYRAGAPVLAGLDFSIGEGENVFLLGPNGAGKTTLLRCLLGQRGYTGSIRLVGEEVRTLSARELAQRVAYIPQTGESAFDYCVRDMVLMGAGVGRPWLAGPGRAEERAAAEAMERLGIADLAARGFQQLSGGERQLVLVARALAQQAKILLMDEPAASLDFGNRLRVMAEISKLSSEGYTVLQSSHDPDDALRYADRVLVLSGGRAVCGAPREIITDELLERLYGVAVRVETLSDGRAVCVPHAPPMPSGDA